MFLPLLALCHTCSGLRLQDTIQHLLALSPTLHFITTPCFVLLSQSINLTISPPYYGNQGTRPLYTSPSNPSSSLSLLSLLFPSILQSSLIRPTCCFQRIPPPLTQ